MIAAAAKLREWRENPVTFVREVFLVEPDAWQIDFLHAYAKPENNRLCLKACKGPGKSAALAWVGWNYMLTRPHPKVVCTAITADNLRDNLWTEFAKWQQRSPLLKQAFTWKAERITANDHPETWWASARAWPKSADASQQADTLAGVHGDFVLFLIDEAGGIPDAVVATAEAGLANAIEEMGTEAKMIIAGNPTHLSGPLYRACTRERHLWWVKEITSDPDDPQRTPRVSVQWAREQIEKYGRDNPWVLVNVFGQFPPGQSNALIGAELASQASRRTIGQAEYQHEAKILGIDVARFGDDRTVFQARQGQMAWRPKVFRNLNTMEVADQAALSIQKWRPDGVLVDQTGVGAGVVDRLQSLGYNVIGIDASSGPLTAMPRFLNRRAEMWWLMEQWLKHGCIPDDGELIAELTAPTYRFNAGGKLQLESKDELKKRGLPSPDKADALALTFAVPVQPRPFRDIPGAEHLASREPAWDYDPFARRN